MLQNKYLRILSAMLLVQAALFYATSRGENIPVKYVEDILYEDARVRDAAIVAMPDPRRLALGWVIIVGLSQVVIGLAFGQW